MNKGGWVYMMTNTHNTVLYIGVTSDIVRRAGEHKFGESGGFAAKYQTTKLVYMNEFGDVRDAIEEEKRLKKRSRKAKEKLIEEENPEWRDLYEELLP